MPRRNRRDKRMDPRELRFLAGEPPEQIQKPKRRNGKWKGDAVTNGPDQELRSEDDRGSED